jgi:hypothetical protein
MLDGLLRAKALVYFGLARLIQRRRRGRDAHETKGVEATMREPQTLREVTKNGNRKGRLARHREFANRAQREGRHKRRPPNPNLA